MSGRSDHLTRRASENTKKVDAVKDFRHIGGVFFLILAVLYLRIIVVVVLLFQSRDDHATYRFCEDERVRIEKLPHRKSRLP